MASGLMSPKLVICCACAEGTLFYSANGGYWLGEDSSAWPRHLWTFAEFSNPLLLELDAYIVVFTVDVKEPPIPKDLAKSVKVVDFLGFFLALGKADVYHAKTTNMSTRDIACRSLMMNHAMLMKVRNPETRGQFFIAPFPMEVVNQISREAEVTDQSYEAPDEITLFEHEVNSKHSWCIDMSKFETYATRKAEFLAIARKLGRKCAFDVVLPKFQTYINQIDPDLMHLCSTAGSALIAKHLQNYTYWDAHIKLLAKSFPSLSACAGKYEEALSRIYTQLAIYSP